MAFGMRGHVPQKTGAHEVKALSRRATPCAARRSSGAALDFWERGKGIRGSDSELWGVAAGVVELEEAAYAR
jgi:hypothetical protein